MEKVAARYQYYGQFNPPVDQFIHERYFAHNPTGLTLIECGAFDGVTESSGKFFEEILDWQAINIEPSARIFAELVANRPDAINLNVALAEAVGEQRFQDVNHPQFDLCTNGSLQHGEAHLNWLESNGCTLDSSTVATTTLAALVEGYDISRIDLMILDVEGCEVQALKGFREARTLPRVLCVEHGHLGVEALVPQLNALGYRYDTSSHVNSFYIRLVE